MQDIRGLILAFFVRALEHLGITPMKQKQVKNPKKSATMDHILLEGHNATYNHFLIITACSPPSPEIARSSIE